MASAKPLCAAQTPSTLCGLVNQILALSGTQDVGCQACGGHAEMTDDVVVSMWWLFRGINALRHPFYDSRPIPPVAWISIRASPPRPAAHRAAQPWTHRLKPTRLGRGVRPLGDKEPSNRDRERVHAQPLLIDRAGSAGPSMAARSITSPPDVVPHRMTQPGPAKGRQP